MKKDFNVEVFADNTRARVTQLQNGAAPGHLTELTKQEMELLISRLQEAHQRMAD